MMKTVPAEILDSRTHVCDSVVVVVPQEIASHADFARLVSCRFVAHVLQSEKFRERLNPYISAINDTLCPGRDLTNDWR
jgi:hypothetical protein